MIRKTLTLAALLAIAALAGCHKDATEAGATAAPAADTSITSAPSASDVQAAIGPQIADDFCWTQADNGNPSWPAPVTPAQFHPQTRAVLNALTADGIVDYTGTSVEPTAAGKKDIGWWDATRGACMGAATVVSVKSVRLNHGNPHAPDGSLDVTYERTLTQVPDWAKAYFAGHVDLSGPTDVQVTLLKDGAAPGGYRIAGVLVADPSQPTGWREDKAY
ncbi:hypothetical protein [Burkholderia gladioli]|uniref:hypothetical protein n=1 Tax=Burkholderia gladioli TaxID=28095 RepID=UPI0016419435|nr:hypothetical protein [Burkholderia gladioli]